MTASLYEVEVTESLEVHAKLILLLHIFWCAPLGVCSIYIYIHPCAACSISLSDCWFKSSDGCVWWPHLKDQPCCCPSFKLLW